MTIEELTYKIYLFSRINEPFIIENEEIAMKVYEKLKKNFKISKNVIWRVK